MTSLEADYASAGFLGQLEFGASPALVIVDVCRAYLDRDCPLFAGEMALTALQKTIALAQCARASGIPVVFTRVEYDLNGSNGGQFFRKVPALRNFIAGRPMAEFVPDLMPLPGDLLITKQYPSGFFATPLASLLTTLKIDTVVITGFSTSGCVRATALDALQFGFVPFVVADACADRADGPHEANLFDLKSKYAEIVSSETAADLMRASREF